MEFGYPVHRCVKVRCFLCVCCQSNSISPGNVSFFSVRVHVGLLLSTVRGLKEIELECICRRYYIGYTWFAPTNGFGWFFCPCMHQRSESIVEGKQTYIIHINLLHATILDPHPQNNPMPMDAFRCLFLPWNRRCRPEVSLGFLVVGLSAFFGEPIVDWNPITSEYLGHLVPNLPKQGDEA